MREGMDHDIILQGLLGLCGPDDTSDGIVLNLTINFNPLFWIWKRHPMIFSIGNYFFTPPPQIRESVYCTEINLIYPD